MTMMQGLPLTGVSASSQAKKRGEIWHSKCVSHIKAMHKLLASLYDGIESGDVCDEEFYNDVEIEKGNPTRHANIFTKRCFDLINLMREPTHGSVEFPLIHIITVLTRCLKISFSDVLSVPSRTDLTNLLPGLHQSCMDVLSQLILCCGGDILFQSHVVLDLCLQTLTSSGKMAAHAKWQTRSSAYQALVLWIRTFGWSSYLTSHSRFLIQGLIADTQTDKEEGLSKKSQEDESQSKHFEIQGKKKGQKRKKKRKGDSYMDLDMQDGVDNDSKDKGSEERLDLVVWGFSLSQLTVENLPFSKAQGLITHLITTASTVQRLSLNKPQPYRKGEVRQELYQTIASCLMSSLDFGCNRNDALSHYQLTNSALNLLTKACQMETSRIQTACTKAMDILRSSECLKGPVIRKVMDFDDTTVEDISELMREKDQMTDTVEDLRQRLMTSEMENEQQSRLISSLKEQIAGLQSQVSAGGGESSSRIEIKVDNESDIDDDDDDDDEEEGEDSRMKVKESHITNNCNGETGDRNERLSKQDHASDRRRGKGGTNASTSKAATGDKRIATEKLRHENILHEDDSLLPSTKTFCNLKRTSKVNDSPEIDPKRTKKSLAGSNDGCDTVEDMLLDFVDAPPDS